MAGRSANIIVGPAFLSIDGTDVGYTQGGVTLRKQEEYLDIVADQSKGVMRKEITMEKMFLTTTLLEGKQENLRIALHEAESQAWSGSAMAFGSANPVAIEHVLTVTGKGVDNKTRTYTFYRAIKADEVEFMLGSRESALTIPLGFELLKDETRGTRFGHFTEI